MHMSLLSTALNHCVRGCVHGRLCIACLCVCGLLVVSPVFVCFAGVCVFYGCVLLVVLACCVCVTLGTTGILSDCSLSEF